MGIHADGTGRIDDLTLKGHASIVLCRGWQYGKKRSAGYQQRPIYGLLHCELSNACRTTLLRPQAKKRDRLTNQE
ncbi:hypothetical protein [Enterobacter hormaechei]|uniref:hypothetical protein n=1 Tax=Enterobacter hormaechei TaxID=158836 RepID=UPI003B9E9E44